MSKSKGMLTAGRIGTYLDASDTRANAGQDHDQSWSPILSAGIASGGASAHTPRLSREATSPIDERPQLVLGFETALLFWRAVHEGRLPAPVCTDFIRLPRCCATSYAQVSRIDLSHLGVRLTGEGAVSLYADGEVYWGPDARNRRALPRVCPVPCGIGAYPGMVFALQVMTAHDGERNGCSAIEAHLASRELPPGSLYRVSDDIMVVSCELAFVQCCRKGRDLPHIELALELCGTYGLMTAGLPGRFDCKPVSTASRLAEFVGMCGRIQGVRAARNAMAWVADMLASPRESEAYLFATLPRKSGGFNLPRPSANVKVHVKGTTAENLTAKEYFKVDLMWEDKKVVLEYDGIDDHEKDPAKIAEDKERRSVLAALGYTVIVMTRRDLESEWTLRSKMAQVALALGTELPVFDAQESRTHAVLFKWLTNPFHDHMPFGCGYR